MFEFKKQIVTFANSGLPYPVKYSNGKGVQIDMPGVPLGSFGGSQDQDFQVPMAAGDVFVLCSDGIFEAFNEESKEFGAERVIDVIERNASRPAKEIVSELFAAVQLFCGDARHRRPHGRGREDQSVRTGYKGYRGYIGCACFGCE